jgi:hypothetical protein
MRPWDDAKHELRDRAMAGVCIVLSVALLCYIISCTIFLKVVNFIEGIYTMFFEEPVAGEHLTFDILHPSTCNSGWCFLFSLLLSILKVYQKPERMYIMNRDS